MSKTVDSGSTYSRTFETHKRRRLTSASSLRSVYSSVPPRGSPGTRSDDYQRETDRQRAQARKGQMKQRDDGLTPEQRRERDAKALQEKAAKKAAQAAVGGGTTDSKNKGSAKK